MVFLLLGSNLGNREKNLADALNMIESGAGKPVAFSAVYETKPWGKTDQPDYLNQAVKIETLLAPMPLLLMLKGFENKLGRTEIRKWEAREIDIDIIFYDDFVLHTDNLIIPHPHLCERRFMLVPMAEIAPKFIHPVLKKSILKLLEECKDPLSVNNYELCSVPIPIQHKR